MARIPTRDLRAAEHFNAFYFAPALAPGVEPLVAVRDAPAASSGASPQLAKLDAADATPARMTTLLDKRRATDGLSRRAPRPHQARPAEPRPPLRPPGCADHPRGRRGAASRPGRPAVCFKPASAQSFAETEKELVELLNLDEPGTDPNAAKATLSSQEDEFGYRWVVVDPSDFSSLVTRVHMVNSTLEEHGCGPQLLCSVFRFHPADAGRGRDGDGHLPRLPLQARQLLPLRADGRRAARQRDRAAAEGRARRTTSTIEKDLDHWFPLWKLPLS